MMGHFSGWIGSVYSYSDNSGITSYFYALTLRKSFLKQDRLNLRLSVNNPFGPNRGYSTNYTVNGDVKGWSRSVNTPRREFSISLSYRFGSLNAVVKKTAKTITNDDLSTGGGNGQQGEANGQNGEGM